MPDGRSVAQDQGGVHLGGFALILKDRAVDDRSAINAFPSVERNEKICEPFLKHQSGTFWTFHLSTPG
jgi:hypothetical protein